MNEKASIKQAGQKAFAVTFNVVVAGVVGLAVGSTVAVPFVALAINLWRWLV